MHFLRQREYQKNMNKVALNISKYNEHSKVKQVLEIQLNLTKTFYDFNFNNTNLINNWNGIKQQTDTKIYINNYINNVLYNIYNFKGNFDIILYKQYDEFVSSQPIENHFVLESGMNPKLFMAMSGGERGRIKLAGILAIQHLINMSLNGNGLNLLILDESLSGIDSEGTMEFVNILENIGSTILLITQNIEDSKIFKNVLTVEKKNGVSRYIN